MVKTVSENVICRKYTNPYSLNDIRKMRLGDMVSVIRTEKRIFNGEEKLIPFEEVVARFERKFKENA